LHIRHLSNPAVVLLLAAATPFAMAQQKPAPEKPTPDTITFTNGDHLTGKLTRETAGSVTFHSDIAGDLTVTWDKIEELHSSQTFAVLEKGVIPSRKAGESQIPIGTLSVEAGQIQLESTTTHTDIAPIPVANAAYIIDKPTLDKQLLGHPGFFAGWNGSATAGATIVSATQNQYTVDAAVALQRLVPAVNWLDPRSRTSVTFNESFGKITQPEYIAAGTLIPATYTKSNIFLAAAERDQYVSKKLYYLGDVSFDHNYAQSLQLEQLYGVGLGYTLLKKPKQELDVKAVAQYERQSFFDTASSNQNLIAATVAANYTLTLKKGIILNQQISYIPAFNVVRDYSANESNTVTFPAYKGFGFTVGTLDSYLNDAPVTLPDTKPNSFQFTMGISYAIKSKY
jgi:hypothetical protein